ncbi:unnamed protein product [Sphenostylis stenocarpa]|uniref:Uncharacterized protein n=1 Tax=Sphenostylis stenocarpa TaxID=92480 RepID=A0AA86RZ55_9FABA|nr:unnamed protein product [Sphenostylis stenocarpa]
MMQGKAKGHNGECDRGHDVEDVIEVMRTRQKALRRCDGGCDKRGKGHEDVMEFVDGDMVGGDMEMR